MSAKTDERNRMVTITVRNIVESDIVWIEKLLFDGARSKHFGSTVGNQAHQMLKEVIAKKQLEFLILRDGKQQPRLRGVKIFIADADGVPASFLMCAEDYGEVELHLAATKKEYQRLGCFGVLIKYDLKEYQSIEKKYARCYRKSTWALDGLIKYNFKITRDGNPLVLVYRND